MSQPHQLKRLFTYSRPYRGRMFAAVAAMIVTWWLIGFHPLLLPTFALEFLPVSDMLPTWTGCVAIVVALRKRQQGISPPPPGPGPVIDV